MACDLISLDGRACEGSQGGIYVSYALKFSDLDTVTFDADGNITAITTLGGALFAKYEYVKDDTAYYNQTGERNNLVHSYNQESFFKFPSITVENQNYVDSIDGCCDLFLVHFLNNGVALAQGIEYDKINDVWKDPRNSTKPTISVMSDTGENESRVESMFTSIAHRRSPIVVLTTEEMDALAGIVTP